MCPEASYLFLHFRQGRACLTPGPTDKECEVDIQNSPILVTGEMRIKTFLGPYCWLYS